MIIGLDVGSTTVKCIVADRDHNIIYRSYDRHFSQIAEKTADLLEEVRRSFPEEEEWMLAVTGSAGMGMAEQTGLPFVQEVYAERAAALRLNPGTDSIIELGGEDAKIIFLDHGVESRMNGSCAGGTGAFIDQMAVLLGVRTEDMDALAAGHEKIYTIASRCGVFAKSDVQPLLNQGARKSDIAASILCAVVNQTIGGLAQGRPIRGNVLYLGGPLSFMPSLRGFFDEALGVKGYCPPDALYYPAIGAALCTREACSIPEVAARLRGYVSEGEWEKLPPLFENEDEYRTFCERHEKADVPRGSLEDCHEPVYLGIDAGSTTLKAAVTDQMGRLLFSRYLPNAGNPVPVIRDMLLEMYDLYPEIRIAGSCVTGYGEDIIRAAFHADHGLVETMAHFRAACRFMPEVDFIVDIGGQDMKCFHVTNGAVDSIFLNEACSSGCGSFLQTFANALGYEVDEFSRLGLFAKGAVDLGSRCTVFMNSSVKQAQKDGASTGDISAGLSVSIVKNAIYKVIRPRSRESLGRHIVVQGGTFLNDAVLRAFEKELDIQAVRPVIAGLMGAYGCALYAAEMSGRDGRSSILGREELTAFQHSVRTVQCGGCENHCQLTVNTFSGGRRFIGGNRCEKPLAGSEGSLTADGLNIYRFKQEYMRSLKPVPGKRQLKVGIPLALSNWEMAPFWHAFFTVLGFETVISGLSDRRIFLKGQASIPSDTVCFPAKLVHGHIEELMDRGVDAVYYPGMSYNFDEGLGDNHYHCPVVAYYPETIAANMTMRRGTVLINDYAGPHRRKYFPERMTKVLGLYFEDIGLTDVKRAAEAAYAARDRYLAAVRKKGEEIIAEARRTGRKIICLAGRPYHADPEISHGIDQLINGLGLAVISEDCLSHLVKKFRVGILNQWTYHARLYAAARYVTGQPDMELVQLVSFGCGLDAITSDEVRSILEAGGKLYTQLKIDEITNLGTVRVRLRSLLAALAQKSAAGKDG